jgi:hypothetical protein
MSELLEPLPTALSAVALAMRNGIPQVVVGKGGGTYNWQEVVAAQRAAALAYLRSCIEQPTDGRRTLREASQALLPEDFPPSLIFLVVICSAGRPDGVVTRLQTGDILYAIMAPNALAEGLVVRRLS